MEPYDHFHIHNQDSNPNLIIEYDGRFFEGSHTMGILLESMAGANTEEEGIESFLSRTNGKIPKEKVISVLDGSFKMLARGSGMEDNSFIWKREIIKSEYVNHIARLFKHLFKEKLIYIVISLTLAIDILYLFASNWDFRFSEYITAWGAVTFICMILLSSFIHELGHASACARYGIESGGIGLALYINFPVMYTDVTKIWRLSVKQRCVVNIAGIYFQCYTLLLSIAVSTFYESDMVKYLIFSTNMGILLTLNPFFKFDGYWLASDLMGVRNLRQKSRKWMISLLKRGKWENDGLSQTKKIIFFSYAVISNLFFILFFIYVIPRFLNNFIMYFPQEMQLLFKYLNNRVAPPFGLVRDILSQTIFMTLLGYWIYAIIANGLRATGKT